MASLPLLCFDVDGTLSTSTGLIPVSRLLDLAAAGCFVVIVSPSGGFPRDTSGNSLFPRKVDGPNRVDNLRAAAAEFPAVLKVYVSDNGGDDEVARQAGFAYCHPKDFP